MAAAEELSFYLQKAAGEFPLTPTTLYWRVQMISNDHLKSHLAVQSRHHGDISKFFAVLWRYFFEYPNINVDNGQFNFPYNSAVISTVQLISINAKIDHEMRLFMNKDDRADIHVKTANAMRIGDIGLKIKKIIHGHVSDWRELQNPRNDNSDLKLHGQSSPHAAILTVF
jgi:hypothetical protein